MASKPSLADMRAGLAAMAAAGDWRPTKAIGDYSDAQVSRKFGAFTKQLDAGEKPSNQAARGHGLTEHGKPSGYAQERAAHPPPPFSEPRGPGRGGGGGIIGGGRDIGGGVKLHGGGVTELPGGRFVIEGHTKASARFGLGLAEGMGEHKRVQVVGYDTDGKAHVIGRKGGLKPEWVRDILKQHRGGMGGAMAAIAAEAGDYGDGEIEWAGDFDIVIL